MRDLVNYALRLKRPPQSIYCKLPVSICRSLFARVAKRAYGVYEQPASEYMVDYMMQIWRGLVTFEYSLFDITASGLRCKLGLASEDRLKGADFPVPFSILYGESDWMKQMDNGHSQRLIEHK